MTAGTRRFRFELVAQFDDRSTGLIWGEIAADRDVRHILRAVISTPQCDLVDIPFGVGEDGLTRALDPRIVKGGWSLRRTVAECLLVAAVAFLPAAAGVVAGLLLGLSDVVLWLWVVGITSAAGAAVAGREHSNTYHRF